MFAVLSYSVRQSRIVIVHKQCLRLCYLLETGSVEIYLEIANYNETETESSTPGCRYEQWSVMSSVEFNSTQRLGRELDSICLVTPDVLENTVGTLFFLLCAVYFVLIRHMHCKL